METKMILFNSLIYIFICDDVYSNAILNYILIPSKIDDDRIIFDDNSIMLYYCDVKTKITISYKSIFSKYQIWKLNDSCR